MEAKRQAFMAGLQAKADAAGTVGTGTFYRSVLDFLKQLAVQQIDTEEERDAIKDMILKAADVLVAPRFPWGWAFIRASLDSFLDERLDALPDLLNAS